MKTKLISLLIFALSSQLLALSSLSAAEPVTETKLVRIQAEVSTGDVTAFFEKSVTVAGITYRQPWESVSWNASDKTVTVAGRTLTYSEVMQLVAAIAAQEKAAKDAPPVPAPPAP